MGKRQPLGTAKQRPGTDITRFLVERRAGQVPGRKDEGPTSDGRYVAGVRAPGGRASTPGKHLLDNVLLSQDADDGGMQVVWASSPTAAFSPQKGPGGSQDAASASQQQAENSQASKDGFRKTLIEAVQRSPSDAELHIGGAQRQQQPVDDMLDQLLARRSSHRAASTSAPGGEALGLAPPRVDQLRPPGPRPAPSLRGGGFAERGSGDAEAGGDDLIMQEVLAGTDTYKTPAAARRQRPVALCQSAECGRPAMCTPSALTLGSKRPLGASGKKAASGGNKRRALLDLLDQVELMVKHRGAGGAEGPSQQPAAPPTRDGRCTPPAGGTEQAAHDPLAAQIAGLRPSDAEMVHGGVGGDAAPAGDSTTGAPPGATRAQATWPAGNRLETALLSTGPADGSFGQPPMAEPEGVPPTQPVSDCRPDAAAAAAAYGGNVVTTGPSAGASAAPCATQSLAMPPPASRLGLGMQAAAATPATQPMSPPTSLVTPYPATAPPGPACAARPQMATPQPVVAAGEPPRNHLAVAPGAAAPAGKQHPAAGASNGSRPPVVPAASAAVAAGDDDDDDDAFWGDVDVDALVASATARQTSPTGAVGASTGAATTACGGPAGGDPAGVGAAAGPGRALLAPHSVSSARPGQQQQQQHGVPQQLGKQRTSELAMAPPAPQRQFGGRHEDAGSAAGAACSAGASASASAAAGPLLGEREEVHFVVLEVEQPPNSYDKVLHCFNEYKGVPVRVCLRDMWADQEVQPGDTVNVVGGRALASPTCATLEVSATEGLLILHPDVLLSGTTICTAVRCARQAWLQERVASGPGGEKALIGSMLHELLQRSLRAAIAGRLDKSVMMDEARSILAANTEKLLESHQDEAKVLSHIAQQLDGIIAWCNSYVAPNPAAPLGGRIEPGGRDAPPTFCRVTEVLDIEESIWAPKYGLKGQLDASLRVRLSTQEPMRASLGVQHWSQQQQQQQGTAHFHGGLRNRRASEGPQPGGGMAGPTGDHVVTGVVGVGGRMPPAAGPHGAAKHPQQQQQHQWSVGKAAGPGAVQPVGNQNPNQQQQQHPLEPPDASAGMIVPFEFKTGKDWHEHRAQVLLYLLLMEDRYATAVRTGLLWNSNKPLMQAVRYAHHELAALISHRNRLAAYLVGTAREPPPPLQAHEAERKCEYCGVAATCALYLAAAAQGDDGSAAATAAVAVADSQAPSATAAAQRQLAEMDLNPALRERLSSISPASAAFFAHWVRLVDLEEHAVRANRADVWALSGPQREQLGGCVSQLLLERELAPREEAAEQRFVYVFGRKSDAAAAAAGGAAGGPAPADALAGPADADGGTSGLLSSGFAPGDCGLLGVEGRHAAAARVTVLEVTKDTLTLASRKELKYVKLGDAPRPARGCGGGGCGGCGSGGAAGSPGRCEACAANAQRVTWRLDRDEAASLFAQLRLNLALLGVPGAGAGWSGGGGGGRNGGGQDAAQARREGILQRLRKLVIELEAPQQGLGQGSLSASSQLSASAAASSQLAANAYLREAAGRMNGEQLEAVQRVLAMQDYAILLGMPGTGKTTTIVHIIRALVETRTSILVASYTNSAVDNILLKLIGTGVSFVRLGSAQAVHPAVRPHMPGGEHHPDSSVAGLHDLMARVHVVGCTCLSVHHPLLAGRTFGVCILDEASQVTLPASIGALALARSFLLVGDHYQLSPLVVSREAAQGGLGVSLFRRLSEAHPQAVVTLRSQYRMAADIMALSNELVYNGRMLCGNDAVARASMHLPYLAAVAQYGSSPTRTAARLGSPPAMAAAAPWPCERALPGWLLALLRPECRVVFLDTDGAAGCREVVLQDGMINRGEAHLVFAVAAALVAAGLPPRDIGVASPYKAQVATLQQALASLAPPLPPKPAAEPPAGGGPVEVLTVDKYQGRDKPAILLSFVRCNTSRSAGRLLADWQRLNVAITRARTKLVLVGSAATLGSIPLLQDMLRLLRRNGWVTQLPMDCLAELPPLPLAGSPAAGAGTAPVVAAAGAGAASPLPW